MKDSSPSLDPLEILTFELLGYWIDIFPFLYNNITLIYVRFPNWSIQNMVLNPI